MSALKGPGSLRKQLTIRGETRDGVAKCRLFSEAKNHAVSFFYTFFVFVYILQLIP